MQESERKNKKKKLFLPFSILGRNIAKRKYDPFHAERSRHWNHCDDHHHDFDCRKICICYWSCYYHCTWIDKNLRRVYHWPDRNYFHLSLDRIADWFAGRYYCCEWTSGYYYYCALNSHLYSSLNRGYLISTQSCSQNSHIHRSFWCRPPIAWLSSYISSQLKKTHRRDLIHVLKHCTSFLFPSPLLTSSTDNPSADAHRNAKIFEAKPQQKIIKQIKMHFIFSFSSTACSIENCNAKKWFFIITRVLLYSTEKAATMEHWFMKLMFPFCILLLWHIFPLIFHRWYSNWKRSQKREKLKWKNCGKSFKKY